MSVNVSALFNIYKNYIYILLLFFTFGRRLADCNNQSAKRKKKKKIYVYIIFIYTKKRTGTVLRAKDG